jgi:hypothetical protein
MHQVDVDVDVEEIMWSRLCGIEEMFNKSLVSVKNTENRASIQCSMMHSDMNFRCK